MKVIISFIIIFTLLVVGFVEGANQLKVDSKCINGDWHAKITDQNGIPLNEVDVKLLTGGMNINQILKTDHNGIVIIQASNNTGMASIEKAGFGRLLVGTSGCTVQTKENPAPAGFTTSFSSGNYTYWYYTRDAYVSRIDYSHDVLTILVTQLRDGEFWIAFPSELLQKGILCDEMRYIVKASGFPISYDENENLGYAILKFDLKIGDSVITIKRFQNTNECSNFQRQSSWLMIIHDPVKEEEGLKFRSINDFVDSLGYLHVIGEIANNGEQAYEYVRPEVTVYDKSGKALDTEFTFTPIEIIPPFGKSPFDVVFTAGALRGN